MVTLIRDPCRATAPVVVRAHGFYDMNTDMIHDNLCCMAVIILACCLGSSSDLSGEARDHHHDNWAHHGYITTTDMWTGEFVLQNALA